MTAEAQTSAGEGELLWEPSAERVAASRLRHFMGWLGREQGKTFADYAELWRYSVSDLAGFWRAVARYFELDLGDPSAPALTGKMPDAHWLTEARIKGTKIVLITTEYNSTCSKADEIVVIRPGTDPAPSRPCSRP